MLIMCKNFQAFCAENVWLTNYEEMPSGKLITF